MQHFIIDTDPGADDAMALMMVLRHAEIQAAKIVFHSSVCSLTP